MRFLVLAVLSLSALRLVPHVLAWAFSGRRAVIDRDLERWAEVLFEKRLDGWRGRLSMFVRLMTLNPEFRNLYYHRIGLLGRLLALACPPMNTLFLYTRKIGPGLFIQHGFATVIAAAEIGENCWINQQVTIGYSNRFDCPTLGRNVHVSAGAKVIGAIRIGDDVIVGANAVVVKDVPANATVAGVPAHIIRLEGRKVHMPL